VRIRFWGVRGTIPSPGPDTIRYGANTSCVDVFTSDQQIVVFDAGTGIRPLGNQLIKEHPGRIVGTIFVTHTHWDHIQGFPFFAPLQFRNNRFVVVGQRRVGQQLENVLAGQISEPYLPFGYNQLAADILVKEMNDGETMVIGDATSVFAAALDHPGGCLGYRLENDGLAFAYCTDTSHGGDGLDKNVLRLAHKADLLVHEASFTPEERVRFPDWGHSSWQEAAEVAQAADVGMLALFHHSPTANDEQLEEILVQTRTLFPRTVLAREGLSLELPNAGLELPE